MDDNVVKRGVMLARSKYYKQATMVSAVLMIVGMIQYNDSATAGNNSLKTAAVITISAALSSVIMCMAAHAELNLGSKLMELRQELTCADRLSNGILGIVGLLCFIWTLVSTICMMGISFCMNDSLGNTAATILVIIPSGMLLLVLSLFVMTVTAAYY